MDNRGIFLNSSLYSVYIKSLGRKRFDYTEELRSYNGIPNRDDLSAHNSVEVFTLCKKGNTFFVGGLTSEKKQQLEEALRVTGIHKKPTSFWIEKNFGPIEMVAFPTYWIHFCKNPSSEGGEWRVLSPGVMGIGLRMAFTSKDVYLVVYNLLMRKQHGSENECLTMDDFYEIMTLYPGAVKLLGRNVDGDVVELPNPNDPTDDYIDLTELPVTWAPAPNRKRQPIIFPEPYYRGASKKQCIFE